MSIITREHLEAAHDFAATEAKVVEVIRSAVAEPTARVRFLGRYTSWNGYFGSGVASLAGKIGRSRGMFLDPQQPIDAVADRSVLVASYFFDAARDEFDDHDTVHRDTHRCLAQATLMGVIAFSAQQEAQLSNTEHLNKLLTPPIWLKGLHERVAMGYGARSPDDKPSIFRAVGYHLGSEVLADQEFSVIDQEMRQQFPTLTRYLETTDVLIADQKHNAYQWLRLHSGHGGGAEADHFDWAVQGVERAFRYMPPEQHDALRRQVILGFKDFAWDHEEFFQNVNS
jgi:hypothetical protein